VSPRSFRGYRLLHPLVAATLRCVCRIATQTEADAERFRALGAKPDAVTVLGNLKFDLQVNRCEVREGRSLREQLGSGRPVLIAASTHEGEEEIVLDAFAIVRERFLQALLIVVPRHPERFDAVAKRCQARGYRLARRSQGRLSHEVDILVGDTMGEMTKYLAASDVAFVAGSMVPVGGHNVLEPAALAVPVIFGPYVFNFAEPSAILADVGAGWRVEDSIDLAATVVNLFSDNALRERAGAAAEAVLATNRGALTRLAAVIEELLEPEIV